MGKRSTSSSHTLPTAHFQQTTATYSITRSNPTRTPDCARQVPRGSFFTPPTPSICTLRTPSISYETCESGVEVDSSSTSSGDSPISPTFLTQPPIQKQHHADQDDWYRSTFHLRASQETESNPSDPSYCLSRRSSTTSTIDISNLVDIVEAVDAIEAMDTGNLPNAPREGTADLSHMDLKQDTVPATARGTATQGTATQGAATSNSNSAFDQMQFDDGGNGNGNRRAGGRGRGTSSARGRGQVMPRGRSGASRTAKRSRARRDADDPGDDDGDNDKAPKSTKKRKSDAPDPPVVYPVEIHRRKTSLRERLIKGIYEPQAIGMRVYNMKKAAAAAAAAQAEADSRNPPRQFLVPIGPHPNAMTRHPLPNNSANTTANTDNAADIPPNPRIAYKSTPIHQLHFPEGLALALKQNMIKWEGKQHSENLVFVVSHLIDGDHAGMHVFSTLRDAMADAIWMMMNEHPEAFALPPDVDADGVEIKHEKYQRATSLLRDINARPSFAQVPMPAAPNSQGHGSVTDLEDEDSLFVVKEENPEMPRPPRFASPRPDANDRGELLLGDAPEPTYVFCGKFRIVSYGLKMEARRVDGAAVKVSVHLKNLRRPAPT
ncbi:hypothetical protein CHU98_g7131 [Xylaria longipes]|nr:hypothetical protein CHU98_g7131 [Xylaria longipes]